MANEDARIGATTAFWEPLGVGRRALLCIEDGPVYPGRAETAGTDGCGGAAGGESGIVSRDTECEGVLCAEESEECSVDALWCLRACLRLCEREEDARDD